MVLARNLGPETWWNAGARRSSLPPNPPLAKGLNNSYNSNQLKAAFRHLSSKKTESRELGSSRACMP